MCPARLVDYGPRADVNIQVEYQLWSLSLLQTIVTRKESKRCQYSHRLLSFRVTIVGKQADHFSPPRNLSFET